SVKASTLNLQTFSLVVSAHKELIILLNLCPHVLGFSSTLQYIVFCAITLYLILLVVTFGGFILYCACVLILCIGAVRFFS
ncbi:hypothetical protein ACJX0J_010454, partial [Zea mays]